jgi:spore germination cell wall hydrolase CwlJ-like protein
MAKAFMKSPNYARDFMNNAQAAAETPAETPGFVAGTSGGPYGAPGDMSGWTDRDYLAAAIQSEAAGEPTTGQFGVGNVIMNRVNSGSYPGSIRDVVMQPGQFSAFNGVTGYAGGEGANDQWRNPAANFYDLADALMAGRVDDVTGGALNYYNPAHASPAWGGAGFAPIAPGSGHVFGTAR